MAIQTPDMYPALSQTIEKLQQQEISEARKTLLAPLRDFVQQKVVDRQEINLNFICTHNSRRSHLAQIWAQAVAAHFGIQGVHCYSGGTEVTALSPHVAEVLTLQGFRVFAIADGDNPVYAVKYGDNTLPVIGFSKRYDHAFNPASGFAAVLTCSEADGGCPFIAGAALRIPVPYEDPKRSDDTPERAQVYATDSLQIGAEMCYVFSMIHS